LLLLLLCFAVISPYKFEEIMPIDFFISLEKQLNRRIFLALILTIAEAGGLESGQFPILL
jgi:hypothetical protein